MTCNIDWLRTTKQVAATRNQTAEVLGIDPRTVSRGVENGEIPSVRIGGRILIPTEELRRMLGVGEVAGHQDAGRVGGAE